MDAHHGIVKLPDKRKFGQLKVKFMAWIWSTISHSMNFYKQEGVANSVNKIIAVIDENVVTAGNTAQQYNMVETDVKECYISGVYLTIPLLLKLMTLPNNAVLLSQKHQISVPKNSLGIYLD